MNQATVIVRSSMPRSTDLLDRSPKICYIHETGQNHATQPNCTASSVIHKLPIKNSLIDKQVQKNLEYQQETNFKCCRNLTDETIFQSVLLLHYMGGMSGSTSFLALFLAAAELQTALPANGLECRWFGPSSVGL